MSSVVRMMSDVSRMDIGCQPLPCDQQRSGSGSSVQSAGFVLGSGVQGSGFKVQRAGFSVQGSAGFGGTWNAEPGTENVEPSTENAEPSTENEPCTLNLEP